MITGLLSAFASGVLTIFFGVVFKHAGDKYDFKNTMLVYALFNTVVFLGIAQFMSGSWVKFAWLPAILSFASGAVNISGLMALQKAMSLGNSGVAWAFCQAGLLGPFFFSIGCFGERPDFLQYVGAIMIVLGMIFLSGGDSSAADKTGKSNFVYLIFAFSSFLLACINGSLGVSVSKIAPDFSIAVRSFCMYSGTVVMLAVFKLVSDRAKIVINKPVLIAVVLLAFFGLSSTVTTFVALNELAKVDMASITVPVLQGTAIGGFALYSTFVLKEKCSLLKWCGIIAIILGIVFLV
ncbi:MAG: hypothetical protein IJW31_06455 [Lentisphaeria bacterium]|nr:hypothetical protein [Lentisphaeria bacterium]